MLPANLISTLKALALTQQPLPGGAADTSAAKALPFELGQKFQGLIEKQVSSGLFQVRIENQLIQMQLPASMRSGQTVNLQVISLQPRLTLALVNSAQPLATSEQLGSVARLLSSMSQLPPQKAYIRALQNAPLWQTPQPPAGKQLAGLLHEALSNSGLFYESHQVQWLQGTRDTVQLLREPQNLAGAAADPKDLPKGNDLAKTGSASAELLRTSDPAQQPTRGAADTANPDTPVQASKALDIPDHLQPLVQQQLNALETRQVLWDGHVWPGQTMQWEIHEEAPQPAAEQQRQWVTQLNLNLPRLGEVAVTLVFDHAGLSVKLNAENAATRSMLGSASTQLIAALADAGITVRSTQITANDHP
ncbi:MAG: flagellar hook-length control protein FliK [Pseudomonadota bacterium]